MSRRTYAVRAERDGKWWVLTVPDVPGAFSQAARLSDAPTMISEAIAFVAGVPAGSFDVDIQPVLDEELLADLATARQATREAETAQRVAASAARAATRRLVQAGLTGRDISALMGVSPQRVSQLRKAG